MDVEQEQNLCQLRQDLELHPGPEAPDKTPTWAIHDPVSGKFFRIGWFGFELISRWHLNDVELIVNSVATETTLSPTVEDVGRLDKFFRKNFLCMPKPGDVVHYEQIEKSKKPSFKRFLQTYLFLRIPLVRPERLLNAVAPMFQWAFTKKFVWSAIFLTIISLLLLSRHWNEFVSTFEYFFRVEGLIVYGLTIFFSKALHEFAHAITAKHYGLRVPTLGVAILVFWPLLYTDASESWKLTDKNKRIAIAGAGILAEILLAAVAGILWVFLDDGALRSGCFLLASTNWITTIIFNMNPFMRFDGYFILSDLLKFENLQQRAFAFSRWKIYEHLFSFGDLAPEPIPHKMRGPLFIYSLCTWAYRVIIIISISLLIYHLFFKLLGTILLIAQLTKVVFLPLIAGTKNLYLRRSNMQFSLPGTLSLSLLVFGVICFFLPLADSVQTQALLLPVEKTIIHAPESGLLELAIADRNKEIQKGSVLFRISSPRIAQEAKLIQIREKRYKHELEGVTFSAKKQEQRLVYLAELEQLSSQKKSLLEEQFLLSIKSPISGILELPKEPFHEGEWVEKNTLLGTVTHLQNFHIVTYFSEFDLHRLHVGATGKFTSTFLNNDPIKAKVTSINEYSLTDLKEPSFASLYKGALPVTTKGEQSMIPMGTYYKVLLSPIKPVSPTPLFELDGTVVIEVTPESLAVKVWNKLSGVFVRESVF